MNYKKAILIIFVLILLCNKMFAQENYLKSNYLGFLPSVLDEPYDTIKALEINIFPFVYEYRYSKTNDLGIQIRPMINYRALKNNAGISHLGGTILLNKYFLNVFDEKFWIKPQLGFFFTYTYNKIDKVQTMILGCEPGAYLKFSSKLSMSLNIQPGIDYFPDQNSKDFVKSNNGFKPHFGLIFHIGYNL
ncbi:hypothetical protein BH10BAC1_BH10BAC1_13190 [soil metagenome]